MSNKKDDDLQELLKWKQEQEKQDAVRKATDGFIMFRCTTVMVTLWTALVAFGAWCADHFKGIEAAIKAFIATEFNK